MRSSSRACFVRAWATRQQTLIKWPDSPARSLQQGALKAQASATTKRLLLASCSPAAPSTQVGVSSVRRDLIAR